MQPWSIGIRKWSEQIGASNSRPDRFILTSCQPVVYRWAKLSGQPQSTSMLLGVPPCEQFARIACSVINVSSMILRRSFDAVPLTARYAAEQASVPALRSSLAWCSSRPGRGLNVIPCKRSRTVARSCSDVHTVAKGVQLYSPLAHDQTSQPERRDGCRQLLVVRSLGLLI
jgi:hypothetical protein